MLICPGEYGLRFADLGRAEMSAELQFPPGHGRSRRCIGGFLRVKLQFAKQANLVGRGADRANSSAGA